MIKVTIENLHCKLVEYMLYKMVNIDPESLIIYPEHQIIGNRISYIKKHSNAF